MTCQFCGSAECAYQGRHPPPADQLKSENIRLRVLLRQALPYIGQSPSRSLDIATVFDLRDEIGRVLKTLPPL